jgi:receptor-type tyrosine-protein phosphatase N
MIFVFILKVDHDPKNAAYIATQGPLPHTTCDFWKMVWEQSSLVIVCLSKTNENGSMICSQYWPTSGCEVYDKFEVNLVSEHLWCEDYLIRSFYLKNTETNETRTVTQFHFLSWPENEVPLNLKSILDFRRFVNLNIFSFFNRKFLKILNFFLKIKFFLN